MSNEHPHAIPLEESPYYKKIERRFDEMDGERPTVSLFVMAKNAESCIGRLIDNVAAYVDEAVIVLNDTKDESENIIRERCIVHKLPFLIQHVSYETNPDLYIVDTKATYDIGRSLAGEEIQGPFMERPILANWSAARNIGWEKCTKKWRLFLDADDVVKDPWSIPVVCKILEENGREVGCSRYHFSVDAEGRPKGSSYRERLALNVDHIWWAYPIHEVMKGYATKAHIDGNLIVRDMRDNQGAGIRIPGRNFKILYHEAREADWEIPPRTIAHLIMEVRHLAVQDAGMIAFADKLLELHLIRSANPEERGWTMSMVGEIHERAGNNDRAIELYEKSLEEHPGSVAAFRLCRALFNAERWQDCIDAYNLGVNNRIVHQTLEDGDVIAESSKILVAGAYCEMDQKELAMKFCKEALVSFPMNSGLLAMERSLETVESPIP